MGSCSFKGTASKRRLVHEPLRKESVILDDITTKIEKPAYHVTSSVLGEGRYGEVRLATLQNDSSRKFAAKILKADAYPLAKRDFLKEVEVLASIDQENVARMHHYYEGEKELYIFTDYYEG